jgi:multiple sugar transport system ATP-binding protein
MADISYHGVTKRYPDGTVAVDALSLHIDDGEFIVLVGPSGSGKSTALRMAAGLEAISDGVVRIGGRVVNGLPPKDRNIAMVFQNYALYPHMTVFRNMEYGLKLQRAPKAERRAKVTEAAALLGIADLLDRRPSALSGGQRQRVAMGRAIVRHPQAFLMDEPLSNLDAKLRVQMRAEISRVHQRLGTTTIYVTHDQTEAMTMGDRVAVMRNGGVEQVDTPQALYDSPANLFVAGFIGSPAMNLLPVRLVRMGDRLYAQLGTSALRIPDALLAARPSLAAYDGREVILGIRPEDIEDVEHARDYDPDALLTATVGLAEPMGAEVVAYFDLDEPAATVTARLDPKTTARDGRSLTVWVDTTRLYFFDADTEAAIR